MKVEEVIDYYTSKGALETIRLVCRGSILDDADTIYQLIDFESFMEKGVNDINEIINSQLLRTYRREKDGGKSILTAFMETNNITEKTKERAV